MLTHHLFQILVSNMWAPYLSFVQTPFFVMLPKVASPHLKSHRYIKPNMKVSKLMVMLFVALSFWVSGDRLFKGLRDQAPVEISRLEETWQVMMRMFSSYRHLLYSMFMTFAQNFPSQVVCFAVKFWCCLFIQKGGRLHMIAWHHPLGSTHHRYSS